MEILTISSIILLVSAFIVLIIATITDLKKSEVPDYLNWIFLSFVIFITISSSILSNNLSILLNAAISFIIVFILGIVLYYGQALGGGDIKLLFGLSIAFSSMPYFFEQKISNISLGNGPFIFSFILNAFLIGAIYGLLFSLYIILKNKKNFSKFKEKIIDNFKYKSNFFKSLFWICVIFGSIILLMSIFTPILTFLAITIFIAPIIFILVKTVEQEFLIKKVNPEELCEGDWLIDKIITKNKTIEPSVYGLTNNQINYLRKNYRGKIKIRFGLPFVPCFLISLILTLFLGNILIKIVSLFL